jgi:hypothetical protein
MRTKFALVFVVFCALLFAYGQDLKGITQHYKPGDTLRYTVEFDGDPKFDLVGFGFYLSSGLQPDQPGLNGYFAINHTTKVRAGVFDVDGVIPQNAPAGTFEIRHVDAAIGPASKQYDTGGLHLTIQVDNAAKYNFPPLKSITPQR